MTTSEKIAHLKGLFEGMRYDTTTNEGKLFSAAIEILEEIASDLEDLQKQTTDLQEYCDELDSDLGDVEEYLLEDAEDEDLDDEDLDDDDVLFNETKCPNCGADVYFDDSIDPKDVVCPSCGEHFTYLCDGECQTCGAPCPDKKSEN